MARETEATTRHPSGRCWGHQGRVGSVFVVGLFLGLGLGLVIGQALGGVIADRWGLTAAFWFAFVGAGITLALVWRQLAAIAHTGDPGAPAGDPTSGSGGTLA